MLEQNVSLEQIKSPASCTGLQGQNVVAFGACLRSERDPLDRHPQLRYKALHYPWGFEPRFRDSKRLVLAGSRFAAEARQPTDSRVTAADGYKAEIYIRQRQRLHWPTMSQLEKSFRLLLGHAVNTCARQSGWRGCVSRH